MSERSKGLKPDAEPAAAQRELPRASKEAPPAVSVFEQLLRPDQARAAERADAERVQRVRQTVAAEMIVAPSAAVVKAERAAYVAKHIPEYLKEAGSSVARKVIGKVLSLAMTLREKVAGWKVEGRELIPEDGPYLAICNHRGGESGVLMGLFADQPMHLVSGEQIHWQRNALRTWVLKKLGMLPVKESLGYLSAEERTALVERAHPRARAGYAKVAERDAKATTGERVVDLRLSVRSIVACLVRGEPVTVFPEGLFLYDNNQGMRRGYPLADAVVLEYERVTGEPLRLLPIAIDRKQVQVGQTFTTKDLPKVVGVSRTDAVVAHVAELLPAERQGYYAPILRKLGR